MASLIAVATSSSLKSAAMFTIIGSVPAAGMVGSVLSSRPLATTGEPFSSVRTSPSAPVRLDVSIFNSSKFVVPANTMSKPVGPKGVTVTPPIPGRAFRLLCTIPAVAV